MRGTLPLLSRIPVSDPSRARPASPSDTPAHPPPTIRLISATPSAAGTASDANNTFANASFPNASFASSYVSVPAVSSPLAPKQEEPAARKRLVPKKSKLGLLVGSKSSKTQSQERGKDLSDVVRRVGGTASAGRGGFEIYVDPTHDPELGEILMVKKKKSRAALDGLRWGPLGEVTNVPSGSSSTLLKPKAEEKEKWWSIGKGRKDSKDKTKAAARAKSPEPPKSVEPETLSRSRFNSLDSGVMLNSASRPERPPFSSISTGQTLQLPDLISDDFHSSDPGSPDELPTPTFLAPPNPATGSIAIRAMRSMRSMARLGSWSQGKPGEKEVPAPVAPVNKKKDKDATDLKKKKKKDKLQHQERAPTVRLSGSSFEAGAPTSPEAMTFREVSQPQPRKATMLGLGLPSTMRFGTARAVSNASSNASSNGPPSAMNRLSADSGIVNMNGRGRSASTISTASSLRPMSTSSGLSAASSSSSTSVKWDEDGLETVKERRMRERGMSKPAPPKETRRTSAEARRRAALADIFPEQMSRPHSQASDSSVPMPVNAPIVTIEEATADGHSAPDEEEASIGTPNRRTRVRPVSEQLLGKERPKAMRDDTEGVLSILDQVTNDLASLISRLDLEATPGTPDGSPLRMSPSLTNLLAGSPYATTRSPLRKESIDSPSKGPGLRESAASVTSLRPYSQSRRQATVSGPQAPPSWSRLGQQIAPWPISPTKPAMAPKRSMTLVEQPSIPAFRLTHKRTLSPAPLEEAPLVFHPLRPAKIKYTAPSAAAVPESSQDHPATPPVSVDRVSAPSSVTFGSRPSKMSSNFLSEDNDEAPSPSPVFRKAVPPLAVNTKGSITSLHPEAAGVPISPEARKGLGLAGTLGGSVGSTGDQHVDSDDPDSDIPDELQVILSGQSDEETERLEETLSFRPPPSPGLPPEIPLPTPETSQSPMDSPEAPVFRAQLIDEDDNHADIDGSDLDDDDTKKSFDFTGELKMLNESGGSDRRSFVEQLESAFRTPAKFDLDGFGEFSTAVDAPPVPALPVRSEDSSFVDGTADSSELYGSSTAAQSSLLPSPEISAPRRARDAASLYDLSIPVPPINLKKASTLSKPSDGQLNVNFKFGGLPSPEIKEEPRMQLTLSDIIPPPSHARSLSMSSLVEEDSSVLKSILALATDQPPSVPRRRVNSDSSSKRLTREQTIIEESMSSHSRTSSLASFSGFESFNEVRRGFEFGNDRPAFYPPQVYDSRRNHRKNESVFSIASVSSYGVVLNPGVKDPFDFGRVAMSSRPPSEDMSMSMSVDDTFSFIRRDSLQRKRVDSDASSFYFHAPGALRPLKGGHRRQDSAMSTNSMAPPISLYNRSFGVHRRNESNSSVGSFSGFAGYAAAGSRASWARHRPDMSVDSVMSDMSAMRLGRPGLGDKMLESAHDYGMPLPAISASPPESVMHERIGNRTSFDSVIDDDRRSSMEDSIFEKTGYRTSVSSESVFGHDDSYPPQARFPGQFHVNEFRPISLLSMDQTMHSPKREDDTMITMLDGGHVRRRSVGSIVEGSPCVRVGKRKHATIRGPQDHVAGSDGDEADIVESPNKARLVEKPSIASTSSHVFGEERMIMARRGILARQSLEEHCLSAEIEDLSFRPQPVFTRPAPTSRSRSSTYSSTSSGAETPPLSSGEGSSMSSDSQSSIASIDLSRLNVALSNMTHPMSSQSRNRVRTRARGHGHRRRASHARASRSSVYETIQEEMSVANTPVPDRFFPMEAKPLSPVADSVIVVDADDTASVGSLEWDDEHGVLAMRRYYALKDEAHVTVEESKRVWIDTPFSLYAMQSFIPPRHPAGMQALLEHSQQNYGHISSELRRIRSRTNSRPSPYPRTVKVSVSPVTHSAEHVTSPTNVLALQERITINPNLSTVEVSPFVPDKNAKNSFGLPARPRVGSNARRSALGWSKRSTGKENRENTSSGTIATPGESLRLNRPRPRGRPTPARPIPVRV
ncbi:hypothetical protein BV25DRAFT_322323 [Artomyces pyxidatus]|uniref:Uncharacterized protein n=1 Tax=Artomyces pyxidatus TaxID=48021 RepID=A0ACB8T8D8_9AGAM|nr:hypothetical protein BV25DRAFT_322323 [Artomyces pyxidatus]